MSDTFAQAVGFSLQEQCVYLSTEALAVVRQCLWGHESRSPGRAGEQGIIPLELVTNTKISYLHMPVISK